MLMLLLAACRTTSVPVSTPARSTPASSAVWVSADSLASPGFRYEWLQARAKVTAFINGRKNEFTAHIRVRHDSVIWISLSALAGLEAARLMLTPDSLRLLDRLDKKQKLAAFAELQELTSVPLTFRQLENLIAGNPILVYSTYQLMQRDSLWIARGGHTGSDSLVFSPSRLLRYQTITDQRNGRLFIENQQYEIQYNQPFALWRKWTLTNGDSLEAEVTFTRIRLNEPLRFPFRAEE